MNSYSLKNEKAIARPVKTIGYKRKITIISWVF